MSVNTYCTAERKCYSDHLFYVVNQNSGFNIILQDLTKFLTDFQADFTPTFLVRSWGDTSLNKKFMIIMRDIQISSVLDWINHLECFITDTVSGANCLNCSAFLYWKNSGENFL